MAYRFRRCCDTPANPTIPHLPGCPRRDSDGTATAAACGDMQVPKDCQARAVRHRQDTAAINPDTDGERA